jgi:hypothetical protein
VTVHLTHPSLSLDLSLPDGETTDLDCLWEGWKTSYSPLARPMTIRRGGSLPQAGPSAAPIAYGALKGWASDDHLVLTSPQGGLCVDYAQASGLLTLPSRNWDRAFARDTLWRLATLELARTQGSYYLHGAAWIGPEGADVVCADGGTGKSTLAAAMLAAGHPVITDDGALLVPDASPTVTALPAAWRLSGPAAAWCGLPDRPDKQRFWPPASLRREASPIGRLFFAERGGRMGMIPLKPTEILPRLIRQNPLLMTSRRIAPAHLEALRQLAETVRAYRLLLGPEMLTNPQAVTNLLAM